MPRIRVRTPRRRRRAAVQCRNNIQNYAAAIQVIITAIIFVQAISTFPYHYYALVSCIIWFWLFLVIVIKVLEPK